MASGGSSKKKAGSDVVEARQVVAPELPESYRWERKVFDPGTKMWVSEFVEVEFLEQTRADWDLIWAGPLAGEYRKEDRPALRRFMVLYDRFNRGELDVSARLDVMEKNWGLTWAERRRQGVTLPPESAPAEAKSKAAAKGRMKVVDF